MSAPVIVFPSGSLRRSSVSELDNNVYLITARSGAQVLIDAADDIAAIQALLDDARADAERTRLEVVVTTHAHHDHVRALGELVARTGAQTVAGAADAAAITRLSGVTMERQLGHGDVLQVGELSFQIIGLRGHTPGSIALVWQPGDAPAQLFSGDSLFPGGVGNTDGDPARFSSLFADVTARIFATLDDATVVWPGHGAATTLGAERGQLEQWRERGW